MTPLLPLILSSHMGPLAVCSSNTRGTFLPQGLCIPASGMFPVPGTLALGLRMAPSITQMSPPAAVLGTSCQGLGFRVLSGGGQQSGADVEAPYQGGRTRTLMEVGWQQVQLCLGRGAGDRDHRRGHILGQGGDRGSGGVTFQAGERHGALQGGRGLPGHRQWLLSRPPDCFHLEP